MRILTTDSLFAWERLQDSASLATVRQFFDLLPDGKLLEALQRHRGKGRGDFPVHVLWRVHVTRYLLRHVTTEACLAELERNPALRKVVGIEAGMKVPRPWNMSRFLEVLGLPQHLALLKEMFVELTRRLGSAVPDLGRHLAGDSASLNARADKDGNGSTLPQPDGGRKEYTDETGKVIRAYEWFGYKFHLLAEVKHEVILDYVLTPATTADSTVLPQA